MDILNHRLTRSAHNEMLRDFERIGHHPTNCQVEALDDILTTLTSMACGTAPPKYYLSSVDPGVGKSTAFNAWLQCVISYEDFKGVGVLICLDRYEQIERLINDYMLSPEAYSVCVTGKDELNDYGLGRRGRAFSQVLLTTKAQLMIKTRDKHLSEVQEFMYLGHPRQVRYWDEGFTEGRELKVDRTMVASLLRSIAGNGSGSTKEKELSDQVEGIQEALKGCANRQVFEVPRLCIPWDRAKELFPSKDQERRQAAETLWLMSGKVVTARTTDKDMVLVDCIRAVPSDFAPCLITDASGRIRETYRLQERERRNLIRLRTAPKDYANTRVYFWRRGAGRQVYNDSSELDKMAKEIALVVDQKPNEEFLVIHYLSKDIYLRDDIESRILRQLRTDPPGRVHFLNWGRHTSTNEFRDIPNVILAGVQFLREPDYEALGRAAALRATSDGPFTSDETLRVEQGETAHNLLQAACRGSIRQGTDTEFNLWVIGNPRKIGSELIRKVFPGCRLLTWRTSDLNLHGKRLDFFRELRGHLEEGMTVIPMKLVRDAVGIKDNNAFQKRIMSPEFEDALQRLGLVVEGSGRSTRFVSEHRGLGVAS